MLRICLILTILAGLGALGISQFRVVEKIKTITAERDENGTQRDAANQAASKSKAEAKASKESAEKSAQELATTKGELETKTANLAEQEKRASKYFTDLQKSTADRIEAQRELAQWQALGVTPDQVKSIQAAAKKAVEERDAVEDEKKVLVRNNRQLAGELSRYKGDSIKVELPAGLKGQIIAVDNKWEFVVLDIGSNQGVLEYGELMVNRNGKLVAKVQVTNVQANRSVANVMADWKQADVQEGDQVLY